VDCVEKTDDVRTGQWFMLRKHNVRTENWIVLTRDQNVTTIWCLLPHKINVEKWFTILYVAALFLL